MLVLLPGPSQISFHANVCTDGQCGLVLSSMTLSVCGGETLGGGVLTLQSTYGTAVR